MSEIERDYVEFKKSDPWSIATVRDQEDWGLGREKVTTSSIWWDFISKSFEPISTKGNKKLVLDKSNSISIPDDLIKKIGWTIGDELFVDIFDEDLKQIVVGKKLEKDDAVKVLNKIDHLLND